MGRRQPFVYGEVAELYDRRRPGYPDALYDTVLALVARPRRALEAAAGTGQATVPLASRGLQIDAVEADAAMAAILRRRTQGLSVRVHEARFEDWDGPASAFDLVLCAQAWHWIQPAGGGAVAARALGDDGAVAIWWNWPRALAGPVFDALQDAYRREAPSMAGTIARLAAGTMPTWRPGRLPGFGAWASSSFEWECVYDADAYAELIQTQSDHRMLGEGELRRLATAVREAIAQAAPLRYPYRTDLLVARPER